jgi:hypothetical protein
MVHVFSYCYDYLDTNSLDKYISKKYSLDK